MSIAAMASTLTPQDLKRESLHMHLPRIQKPAPFFKGPAIVKGEMKEISLDNYKGKYIVLLFYPMDFTFVCPTELIAFSDQIQEFRDINTEVIGISTDSQYSHFAWVNTPKKQGGVGILNIPLLADKNMSISKSYGILHHEDGVAFRGIFIIDNKGILRQATINDMPIGRSTEETIRLIKAIQYFEENGEVCPANWKPGKDTIKPDVEKCKEFFEKN